MNEDRAGSTISRRASRRLLTTLMMSTALCLGVLPAVMPVPRAAAQAARTHSFDIASQPLNAALRRLAEQTGVQIAYETSVAAGTIAPAVSGTMSAEDALAELLSGSGLRYSFTSANTVTILATDATPDMGPDMGNVAADGSTVLDTIMVTTAGGFAQQVVDAPASITVIPGEDLENKPFRSLIDAVRHVEGVTMAGGDNGDITIRGMPASGTLILVDGRRQNSTRELNPKGGNAVEDDWMPPIGAVDRIEVVRGPMSSRYGSDAMGGVINIITKKVADTWSGSVGADATLRWEFGTSELSYVYDHGSRDAFSYKTTDPVWKADNWMPDITNHTLDGNFAAPLGERYTLSFGGQWRRQTLDIGGMATGFSRRIRSPAYRSSCSSRPPSTSGRCSSRTNGG